MTSDKSLPVSIWDVRVTRTFFPRWVTSWKEFKTFHWRFWGRKRTFPFWSHPEGRGAQTPSSGPSPPSGVWAGGGRGLRPGTREARRGSHMLPVWLLHLPSGALCPCNIPFGGLYNVQQPLIGQQGCLQEVVDLIRIFDGRVSGASKSSFQP